MPLDSNRNPPRLTRSRHRVIAGVCGGLAGFLGWQPKSMRGLWGLATLFSGVAPSVLAYVLLALAMPLEPDERKPFDINDFRVQ